MEKSNNNHFSEEAIKNFVGFFNTLKKIHIRLINDGWDYKDGKLIPPNNKKIKDKI